MSMYTMPTWTGRDIHEDTREDDTGVKREQSDYVHRGHEERSGCQGQVTTGKQATETL